MKNTEDSFKCIENKWFPESKKVSNCRRYSRFTDNHVICVQCHDGYALVESTNSCVTFANCSGTVVIGRQNEDYEFSIFDEKFIICDTTKDKNLCAIQAIANSKNTCQFNFRRYGRRGLHRLCIDSLASGGRIYQF